MRERDREKWLRRVDKATMLGASDNDRALLAPIREADDPREVVRLLNEVRGLVVESARAMDGKAEDTGWRLGRVNRIVVSQLRRLGARDEIESLLGGGIPGIREEAAWALSALRDPEATPTLMALLDDDDSEVVRRAAEGLGALRHRPALPRILELLQGSTGFTRVGLAGALASYGDPSLEPALKRARRRELRPWIRFAIPKRVKPVSE